MKAWNLFRIDGVPRSVPFSLFLIMFQVIATKLISEEGNVDRRFRIMLWDGESLYKHGLLITNTLPPPSKFSIIRSVFLYKSIVHYYF